MEKSGSDKRSIVIVITEKGRSWGAQNLERNVSFVRELFDGIPKEDIRTFAEVQQMLIQKLVKLKEQLRSEAGCE